MINPRIAFPDTGFGFGGGSFIGEQFYFLGVFSDANGQFDKIDFFPGGAEFFKSELPRNVCTI